MSRPIGGITTSDTNDVTIFPNAPPMITPTAMSITLPLRANVLNSLSSFMLHVFKRYSFNVAILQKLSVYLQFKFRERCSSGLRGTPGKRVYDKIVSRVRIPISPQSNCSRSLMRPAAIVLCNISDYGYSCVGMRSGSEHNPCCAAVTATPRLNFCLYNTL